MTPDRWKSHREHLEVAQSWATKALADDPRDPEFFAQLIMLCRSQGCPRQTAEAWLARALAINPGYDGVYVDMANYLLPRWLGSPEEFVAFAARAADENKTLGNIAYARIATVALLVDGRKGGVAFREMYPGLSWQRIRDGLSEIDRRFPGSARTYHLLARFAHVYEDKERGRAALTRLGTTWDLDGEDYWPTEKAFRESREWAFGADR